MPDLLLYGLFMALMFFILVVFLVNHFNEDKRIVAWYGAIIFAPSVFFFALTANASHKDESINDVLRLDCKCIKEQEVKKLLNQRDTVIKSLLKQTERLSNLNKMCTAHLKGEWDEE